MSSESRVIEGSHCPKTFGIFAFNVIDILQYFQAKAALAEGTLTKTMDSDLEEGSPAALTTAKVKAQLNAIEDKINDILAADNQIGGCPA